MLDKPRPGRPRAIGSDQEERLAGLIIRPTQADIVHWTAKRFHGYLNEQLQIEHCCRTVVRWLHEQDFGLTVPQPCPDRQDEQQRHSWLERLRVLMSGIERAAITSQGGRLRFDLPREQRSVSVAVGPGTSSVPGASSGLGGGSAVVLQSVIREMEKKNIQAALDETGWQVHGPDGAAALLGMRPTTLASRIKRMGLRKGDG